MSSDLIRSFIAIELPELLKADITQLIKSLKTNRQDWVKWVSPDSIHLTLKFLGDVPTDKIEEVLMAMKESVKGISPFVLQIKGMGVFPDLKRIQVIWVGLAGDLGSLKNLQQNIESNLEILGYPVEGREFTPHLTLGRIRYAIPAAEQPQFAELISKKGFESSHSIQVDSINLMKSQLTPRGAIYTRIETVNL